MSVKGGQSVTSSSLGRALPFTAPEKGDLSNAGAVEQFESGLSLVSINVVCVVTDQGSRKQNQLRARKLIVTLRSSKRVAVGLDGMLMDELSLYSTIRSALGAVDDNARLET